MSHQVAVMYLGNVVELLEKGRLSVNGVHPYTKALINLSLKWISNLEKNSAVRRRYSESIGFAAGVPISEPLRVLPGNLQKRKTTIARN